MATFKHVFLWERTNVAPSPALNAPDSLSADLDRQLADKITEFGLETATLVHYQIETNKASGRRHCYIFSIEA